MITVQGHSDDLIVVEGDINEEFSRPDSKGDYLAFSDGTLLRAVYDDDGIWRTNVIFRGTSFIEKVEGSVTDDRNDVVRLGDGIAWCVCGKDHAIIK